MGTQCTSLAWAGKGFKGTNGLIVAQFRINANWPVAQFCGGDCFNTGMVCTWYGHGVTQDATGFFRGFEVMQGSAMQRYCASETSCLNGRFCRCLQWMHCDGSVLWTSNGTSCINIPAPGVGFWTWQYYQYFLQIGTNAWEIDVAGNHYLRSCVTCVAGSSDNLAMPVCCASGTVTNAPSAPSTGATRGVIWVEGNNLNFRPEQTTEAWEHSMAGVCQGAGGTAGAIWIDNTHFLNWVNSGGDIYKASWRICQFASIFSNSAGANPSPGAGSAGAIWADGEFGYSHLAYIGCDGNKYITGAGNCNTVVPS